MCANIASDVDRAEYYLGTVTVLVDWEEWSSLTELRTVSPLKGHKKRFCC